MDLISYYIAHDEQGEMIERGVDMFSDEAKSLMRRKEEEQEYSENLQSGIYNTTLGMGGYGVKLIRVISTKTTSCAVYIMLSMRILCCS